jgi:hypothetical protein
VELYHYSPNTPSWYGDQLKEKAQEQLYHFTFTFFFLAAFPMKLIMHFSSPFHACCVFFSSHISVELISSNSCLE